MANENLDDLVVKVRADTSGFLSGISEMQRTLDGPFSAGLERAGSGLQRALGRALSDGKVGFDDLRRIALAALGEISRNALQLDLGGLLGNGSAAAGLGGLLGGLLGLPGRATGGPVAAGRAYVVGERGPELFVPTAAGRIDAPPSRGAGGPVSITVNVAAPPETTGAAMQQTGRQVARAVARALDRARS